MIRTDEARRISLLVPCFNAVRFLPRLRTQVDRLTTPFDEVILVDDASSDETFRNAVNLGFRIKRLETNRGPGGARNALAQIASCEWIHFHDVDDELDPDYVQKVHDCLNGDVDLLLHQTDFVDELDRTPIIRWSPDPIELERSPEVCLLRHPLPTMCSCIRLQMFLKVGGFNEQRRCFEDGDLHFRLALKGARCRSIQEVLETSLRSDTGAGADQNYCFKCRTEFLEDYETTCPPTLRFEIAREAERTAIKLLRFNNPEWANRALQICQRSTYRVPSSNRILMRLLRRWVSPLTLLRWQDRFRSLHF